MSDEPTVHVFYMDRESGKTLYERSYHFMVDARASVPNIGEAVKLPKQRHSRRVDDIDHHIIANKSKHGHTIRVWVEGTPKRKRKR